MAQSGWRLPDDLLRRVRVRAAESGVAQNVLVERALESALGDEQGGGSSDNGPRGRAPAPASSRAPAKPQAPVQAVVRPGTPSAAAGRSRAFVLDPRQAALNKAKKS